MRGFDQSKNTFKRSRVPCTARSRTQHTLNTNHTTMQRKMIWSHVSYSPHHTHLPSPGPFRFWTWSPLGILFLTTCQKKIFILDGILAFQNLHRSQGGTGQKIYLYKDPVENSPDGSSIQVTSFLQWEREVPTKKRLIWSHSMDSIGPNDHRKHGCH